MDTNTLFNISYGLYVLSGKSENNDNACITNTFLQVTSAEPFKCTITVSKSNYTHNIIKESKKFNLSVLSEKADFEIFKNFGFQSGKNIDKFTSFKDVERSENGILYITRGTNSYLSFEVENEMDFGSHTMFSAILTDAKVLNKDNSATYSYYHQHIKPKPQEITPKGHRCIICGYVYEGDPLPEDFICPICKHGIADFEKC